MSDPNADNNAIASSSGAAAKPSLKDRLQKLRIQRSEASDIGDTNKAPKPSYAPANAEERRKLLQRLRDSRTSVDASRRSTNFDRTSDDASDARSETSSVDPTVKEYEPLPEYIPEELLNIRSVEMPSKDFNLTFYELWDREKAVGPHIILPAVKPDFSYNCDKCTISTLRCCSPLCGTCFPDMGNETKPVISTERDLILQHKRKKILKMTSDIESQIQFEKNDWYEPYPEFGLEEDGIFQDFFPILLPILLSSEVVPPSIASFTGPHVYLSRMTQRLLRELKRLKLKTGTLDEASATNSDGNNDHSDKPRRKKITFAEAALLKLLNHHFQDPYGLLERNNARMFNVSMRMIHNPVNYSLRRSHLPHVDLNFGGRLGQWPVDATAIQRYGPLPNSFQYHASQGSLLKLFILHCNLEDHPLMNIEERHAIYLKDLFTQYCQIFDEKMIEYLSQKLLSLLSSLMRWTEPIGTLSSGGTVNNRILTNDEYLEVDNLYEELVQILPELNELSKSIHQLTVKIYHEWRDIKEFRRRQTFTCTPILLRMKKIRSNLAAAGGKRKKPIHVPSEELTFKLDQYHATPRVDTARSTGTAGGAGTTEWNLICMGLDKLPQQLHVLKDLLVKQARQKKKENESKGKESKKSNDDEEEEDDPVVAYYREQNLQKTEEQWQTEFKTLEFNATEIRQLSGLLPPVAIQLSENGMITPDAQLPAIELKRRKKIKQTRINCVVRLDGQVASSTFYHHIKYPEFKVDFRSYLEMKVLHMPNEITVDIFCKHKRISAGKVVIGQVYLPPPGKLSISSVMKAGMKGSSAKGGGGQHSIHTHSNSTHHGRYTFASTNPIPKYRNTSLYHKAMKCFTCGNYQSEESLTTYSHQISGSIYCALEFDPLIPRSEPTLVNNSVNNKQYRTEGVDASLLAVFPAPELPSATTNSFSQSLLNDFTRENDFQQLLPPLHDIDWNDPMNDVLLYLKSKRMNAIKGDYFHLFGNDYSIPFKSMLFDNDEPLPMKNGRTSNYDIQTVTLMNFTKLKCPLRLLLLKLRVQKPFLFYHLSIPLNNEEIKQNEELKQIIQDEITPLNHSLLPGGNQPELTEKQLLGKESVNVMKATNFLQRVRHSATVSSRKQHKKRLQTSSVVLEKNFFPELKFLPLLFSLLCERKRELKPKKKMRQPEIQKIESCDVLVQVIGAKNIPLRLEFNDGDGVGGSSEPGATGTLTNSPSRAASPPPVTGAPAAGGAVSGGVGTGRLMLNEVKLREKRRVHSFVEVRFQDSVIATTTFEGTTPMWKESLALPFLPPKNDFSPIGLDQIREEIYFTLFDEVYVDDRERGGFLEGESTTRVDRYYLGSFSIPFNAIYHEGKIEGVFRLDTPVMNFGYEKRAMKNAGLNIPINPGASATGALVSTQRLQGTVTEGLPRSASASSLNGLLTTAHDEPEPGALNTAGSANNLNNDAENIGPIPTNRVISTTNTLFTLLTLFWYFCMDCCPNFREIFDKIWYYLSKPFETTPFVNYYNNLYLKSNHILPETQLELSSYASDERTTFIKMMITFDPLLPVSREIAEEVSPGSVIADDRMIAIYAMKWLEQVRDINEHTAHRPYKLFAMNSSGLQVFLCRFLTSQSPPPEFHSRRACIHLVSMIPFVKDIQSFIGAMDLWCTNQQFWEIGAGDEEEHAIMLYNYFRYFKNYDSKVDAGNNNNNGGGGGSNALTTTYSRSNLFGNGGGSQQKQGYIYPPDNFIKRESVFLALGKAFPEGDTVYLLVRDWNLIVDDNSLSQKDFFSAENYLVINPWTGHVYSAIDPYCPLKEIHTLATPYNLWVNIQAAVSPSALKYDILNSGNWRGFFNPRFPPIAGGIQTIQQDIEYFPTEQSYCDTIEKTVFQSIRNSLRKWRSKRSRPMTTFHPEASNVMLELLPRLEEWKKNGDFQDRARLVRGGRLQATVNTAETAGSLDLLQDEVKKRLSHLLRTRVLRGFPINIPFTDVDEILTQVKTFCVHENNHPEVQFVLAVKAMPLFNNTISLWIFLGTLEVTSLSERSESSTMRIMKSLLVMASPLIFCFFILLSTSAYYQRPSFSQRRLIQLPVLPFRFGGTSASSTFSFCFLESNSWEIRTKAIHFLIDPVLDTLDFGIPWLYSGKKRVLNGPEELSRLVKNHRQSSPSELSSEFIDFILISQGLDDHAHKPTLTRLQKLLPDLLYIIPPSAEKILLGCGINKKNMIILSHGQSFEKKKLGETLKIIATSGALVGPPWQEKENGYVIQSVNDKSSLSSFYYEPHGMFNPEELREYEGKIPIVISPIVSQEISISDAVPSYTLVAGNEQVIDLVEKLKPKYLIPMLNGDLNQAGLLASILKTTGSELEFEETLRKNTKIGQRTAFVRNIVPGKVFSL